mmetsp:Transcript_128986/g.257541  ORF Transcript_128986/g.257541 Transcript_128986/m.257541 type:complete len:100 (-) Transcript_128986:1598-1897(-)
MGGPKTSVPVRPHSPPLELRLALPSSTLRARAAKFKELNVSVTLICAGEHCTIINVLESPPKESFNIIVSFEFLYGTCGVLATKEPITSPRALRLLLIF